MQIQKNVPMPKKDGINDILRRLELGDSFVLEDAKYYNGLASRAKSQGIKIQIKTEKDTGVITVWRIK